MPGQRMKSEKDGKEEKKSMQFSFPVPLPSTRAQTTANANRQHRPSWAAAERGSPRTGAECIHHPSIMLSAHGFARFAILQSVKKQRGTHNTKRQDIPLQHRDALQGQVPEEQKAGTRKEPKAADQEGAGARLDSQSSAFLLQAILAWMLLLPFLRHRLAIAPGQCRGREEEARSQVEREAGAGEERRWKEELEKERAEAKKEKLMQRPEAQHADQYRPMEESERNEKEHRERIIHTAEEAKERDCPGWSEFSSGTRINRIYAEGGIEDTERRRQRDTERGKLVSGTAL